MSSPGHPELARQTTRISQIIVSAMLMGVSVFAGIVIVLGMNKAPAANPMVAYMGLFMAAAALIARLVMPDVMARMQIAQLPPVQNRGVVDQRLYMVYQTRLILGAALLEGAIFFNLVAYMIDGRQWSLAAAGLLALVMVGSFPTLPRVNRWVENQTALIELNKTMGPRT